VTCPRELVASLLWAGLLAACATTAPASPAPPKPAAAAPATPPAPGGTAGAAPAAAEGRKPNIATLPVKLYDLDGKPVDLPRLLGPKLTVLNLWATWCQPCRREIPFLTQLDQKMLAKGVKVIGISIDASRDGVAAAAKSLGARYQVLYGGTDYGQALDVKGIPITLILDSKGVLLDGLLAEVNEEILVPRLEHHLGTK
jgi:thiol-disulfide isomerase/thioredoxin